MTVIPIKIDKERKEHKYHHVDFVCPICNKKIRKLFDLHYGTSKYVQCPPDYKDHWEYTPAHMSMEFPNIPFEQIPNIFKVDCSDKPRIVKIIQNKYA